MNILKTKHKYVKITCINLYSRLLCIDSLLDSIRNKLYIYIYI